MADYSFEEQQSITKEMSDKIYNDSYTTTEEELVKDVNWIQASKDVYKQLEGVEWSGSDEDAAKKGLDMMGRFNYNLTLGTINYTTQLQDAPDQTKLSFYYLMDMYDKKDISGNGVLRAFKEMGLDPASYIGIGTLGAGFVGKQAAAQTAKAGVKEMLKRGAIKYLQSTTAVAATEGAIYTAADDIARQEAAIGAGVQDEYSPGQTAVAAGVGGAVGAGFVQGAKAVGKGINKVITAGEEEMAKMAGGGTPPKIEPKGDMIMQHNLSQENLAYAQKQGGVSIPSFAITNKNTPLEGFGEITMLGDEALATPTKEHRVFGADIYSPRHPREQKEFKATDIRKMDNELATYQKELGGEGNLYDSEDITKLSDNLALKMKFLKEVKGETIDIPTKQHKDEQVISQFYPDEYAASIANKGVDWMQLYKDPAFKAKVIEDLKAKFAERGIQLDPIESYGEEGINNIARDRAQTIDYIGKNQGKPDFYAARDILRKETDKYADEFNQYVEDFTSPYTSKSYFYANNTKKPYNEQNVLKFMTKNLRGGENFNYGAGNIRAMVTPEFKTIKQIKAAKDKLVSSADFESIKDSMNNELLDITASIKDPDMNSFIATDIASEFIQDYAKRGKRALNDYAVKASDKDLKRIDEFLNKLQEMPTEYFETKMLKKMDLGEFKYAVIPSNASDQTKKILEKNGIEYSTYDPGLDGDRIKQIQKAAEDNGYLFSLPASLGLAAAATQGENNDNN